MITNAVSLFDGIGGLPLGLERAGIPTMATVEIDAAARGVSARAFPWAKQFTDVQEVTGDDLLGADFRPETGIITAGWPCQGNSVAGRRGGMDDPRSGLWWEVVRILRETRPRWFLGENVPGLLAIHGGLDFWLVKESLEELGYGLAWRVLDAQYFGVPQQRKRVFLVGCLGDGAGPAQVLLEPESSAGDPAAGREAGAQAAGAAVVSTLQGGGRRGYRVDAEAAAGGHLIPFDAIQITSGENRSNPQPGDPAPTLSQTSRTHVAHTLTAGVAASPGVNPPGRRNEDDYNLVVGVTGDVAHTLRAEGADASEDGTGRGTPIVAYAIGSHAGAADGDQTNRSHASGGPVGSNISEEMAYALRASRTQAVAYAPSPDVAHALTAHRSRDDHNQNDFIPSDYGVRRLTPRECERLQGFPDDWTAGQSDSARYRQLGNAVAVPVVEWLVRRIVAWEEGEVVPAAA